MTRLTLIWYARLFLCIPLVVSLGASSPKPLGGLISAYFVVGAWLARVPYSLFAASALAYTWKRDAEAHYRLAKVAPLAFLPYFAGYLYLSEALGRTGVSSSSDVAGIALWSLVTLPFGYAYVGLFFLGARVLFGPRGVRSRAAVASN